MKIHIGTIAGLVLLAGRAHAETSSLDINVSAATELSDNATREPLDADKIEERQNIFSGGLRAHYNNDWASLESRYDASRQEFLEDSQENFSRLEGNTELLLGNDAQPFNLRLAHNRSSMLSSPELVDLNSNRDERTILTAEPAYKIHFKNADAILIKAAVMSASYGNDDSRKAKRNGIDVAWQHGLSKVDQLELVAQASKTKFDSAPASNYRYENIGVLYSVQLSRLNYSLMFGGNRAVPDNGLKSTINPSYSIEVNYEYGNNSFKFSSKKRMDDSSFGSTRRVSDVDQVLTKPKDLDIINIEVSELSWGTKALCERCDFSVHIGKSKESYNSLASNDTEEIGGGARFNYKFSRAAGIRIDLGRHKRTFVGSALGENFLAKQSVISFDYKFIGDLKLQAYIEKQARSSNNALKNYDENITGLSLSYAF